MPAAAFLAFPQAGGRVVTIHDRHLAVHQHEIVILSFGEHQRLDPIVGNVRSQPQIFEHGTGKYLIDGIVLRQQYPALQPAIRNGRPVIGCRRHGHRLANQDVANHLVEIGLADRFVHVAQDAGAFARARIARIGGRRQHHPRHGRQRGLGGHCLGQLQPVHLRHVHVENGELERIARFGRPQRFAQGFRAAGDATHAHGPTGQLRVENLAVGLVVIHDQHAQAGQFGMTTRHPGQAPGAREIERDPEAGTLPGRAVDANTSAHHLHQALADRQPQPGAAELAGGRAVGLGEMLENLSLRLRRDADAGILHAQLDLQPLRSRRTYPGTHHDFAAGGELDGVVEQIDEHLPQAHGIPAHQQRRVGRNQLRRQFEPLGRRRLGEHRRGILDHLAEIEIRGFQLHAARFDLGKIENVVDDVEQMPAGTEHHFCIFFLGRVETGSQQQFGHTQHAVHRGANLVAHRRQKLALGLARGLCLHQRHAQLVRACLHHVLEMLAMLPQAFLAAADLIEHLVESPGQAVELGNVAGTGAHLVGTGARHAVDQAGKLAERLQHLMRQARK